MALTREQIRALVDDIAAKARAKREAGLCAWVDCERPALGDRSFYFFGDDHCEEHARQAEIECLEDAQTDDAAGREP